MQKGHYTNLKLTAPKGQIEGNQEVKDPQKYAKYAASPVSHTSENTQLTEH